MDWDQLFTMQRKLDSYIETNHGLKENDLFQDKVLALLVEVGELANETRCFKFWSNKEPSAQNIIIEEYVDGIHFILSLGLEKSYSYEQTRLDSQTGSVTDTFNQVFEKIIAFKQHPSKEKYNELFQSYINLGNRLGFDESDVKAAYYEKNKVNFERQDQGY